MNTEDEGKIRIVFHGELSGAIREGIESLLDFPAEITVLPNDFTSDDERQTYASADILVSGWYNTSLPPLENVRLFQLPGAGYDGVDLAALPASAVVCNCFGHEQPIAEYIMTALLLRQIPLVESDKRLRLGEWTHLGWGLDSAHDELAGKTIGLLGYGRIGKAVAQRAKAFEMTVHAANRSPLEASELVDRVFSFDELREFWGSADFIVSSLPLSEETRSLVGAEAFAAMRPQAVVVNVGRGPVVDETALYEALTSGRIAGAIIDTWYNYPTADKPKVFPSGLPFQQLSNVLMTPHMSAWTRGTIRRRQQTIAENIRRRLAGEECLNVIRPAQS